MAVTTLDVSSISNLFTTLKAALTAAGLLTAVRGETATLLQLSLTNTPFVFVLSMQNTGQIRAQVNRWDGSFLSNTTDVAACFGTMLEAYLITSPNTLTFTMRSGTDAKNMSITFCKTDLGAYIAVGAAATGGVTPAIYEYVDWNSPVLCSFFPTLINGAAVLNGAGTNYVATNIHVAENTAGYYFGKLAGIKMLGRLPVVGENHYVRGNDVVLYGGNILGTSITNLWIPDGAI